MHFLQNKRYSVQNISVHISSTRIEGCRKQRSRGTITRSGGARELTNKFFDILLVMNLSHANHFRLFSNTLKFHFFFLFIYQILITLSRQYPRLYVAYRHLMPPCAYRKYIPPCSYLDLRSEIDDNIFI